MAGELKQLQKHPEALPSANDKAQRDKFVLHVSLLTWLYPTMILLSTVSAILFTFMFSYIVIRRFIIIWFIFICPGMTIVQFFQLNEAMVEWPLALALSIAIDAFIASILLYAGWWSPIHIFIVLIGFCFIGTMMELVIICSGSIHGGQTLFRNSKKAT